MKLLNIFKRKPYVNCKQLRVALDLTHQDRMTATRCAAEHLRTIAHLNDKIARLEGQNASLIRELDAFREPF